MRVNDNMEWSGHNMEESFELKEQLGTGSFGIVYRAVHRASQARTHPAATRSATL